MQPVTETTANLLLVGGVGSQYRLSAIGKQGSPAGAGSHLLDIAHVELQEQRRRVAGTHGPTRTPRRVLFDDAHFRDPGNRHILLGGKRFGLLLDPENLHLESQFCGAFKKGSDLANCGLDLCDTSSGGCIRLGRHAFDGEGGIRIDHLRSLRLQPIKRKALRDDLSQSRIIHLPGMQNHLTEALELLLGMFTERLAGPSVGAGIIQTFHRNAGR